MTRILTRLPEEMLQRSLSRSPTRHAHASGERAQGGPTAQDARAPSAAPMAPDAISLTGIGLSYTSGSEQLDILSGLALSVRRGEHLAIIGASGSGKSSLLAIMAGLMPPTRGLVALQGVDLATLSESRKAAFRAREIGFVFQSFELLEHATALENVCFPSALIGTADEARARELLMRVGLGSRLTHYPTELSGGEMQRVAIARSLMNRPGIIFADEPTGSLDEKTGEQVFDLLIGSAKETGAALILVTHDTRLASRMDAQYRLTGGILTRTAA